jgi:hypothetical protein
MEMGQFNVLAQIDSVEISAKATQDLLARRTNHSTAVLVPVLAIRRHFRAVVAPPQHLPLM